MTQPVCSLVTPEGEGKPLSISFPVVVMLVVVLDQPQTDKPQWDVIPGGIYGTPEANFNHSDHNESSE